MRVSKTYGRMSFACPISTMPRSTLILIIDTLHEFIDHTLSVQLQQMESSGTRDVRDCLHYHRRFQLPPYISDSKCFTFNSL